MALRGLVSRGGEQGKRTRTSQLRLSIGSEKRGGGSRVSIAGRHFEGSLFEEGRQIEGKESRSPNTQEETKTAGPREGNARKRRLGKCGDVLLR